MRTTFHQYMRENYDNKELQNISDYGCEGGCAGTLIYYSDTNRVYDQYAEDLHDIIGEYMEYTGEYMVPAFITRHFDTLTNFKNDVVWFCAELVATDLIQEMEAA